MERYQIILGYDGTTFGGMQRQVNTATIQGELEDALRRIGWSGRSVLIAGRTDAGVHASGQVVAFDLDWNHDAQKLVHALNANLPAEIAVQAARTISLDFHPRFDALSRTYDYRIFCQPVRDPLRERFAWRVWPRPEKELLDECAAAMTGEHDFSAFGTPLQEGGTTIRKVFSAKWTAGDDQLSFTVSANAFLYHMVRRMVLFQVETGQGKRLFSDLSAALEGLNAKMIQGLAPANGLFLRKVAYPE